MSLLSFQIWELAPSWKFPYYFSLTCSDPIEASSNSIELQKSAYTLNPSWTNSLDGTIQGTLTTSQNAPSGMTFQIITPDMLSPAAKAMLTTRSRSVSPTSSQPSTVSRPLPPFPGQESDWERDAGPDEDYYPLGSIWNPRTDMNIFRIHQWFGWKRRIYLENLWNKTRIAFAE